MRWKLFALLAALCALALVAALLLPTLLYSAQRSGIVYTCVYTWSGVERAAVLDTEAERACGLNCVDARVAVFVWDRAPRVVTFVNNLNDTILVYHVVGGEVRASAVLKPGDTVTFVTASDSDYFIEARGGAVLRGVVVYTACGE